METRCITIVKYFTQIAIVMKEAQNLIVILQWDSLQYRRAVADLCMFHKLRNNLANIAIPPILVPSVKHNCHYNHIQSLHSDASDTIFLPEV